MQDIFDYCAAPLLQLIEDGTISAEAGELFLAALAWFLPLLLLAFFIWAAVALLGAFLGVAGGGYK